MLKLKYSVCIGIFLFTFCYSTVPLAVPFTVENVRWAQKKCLKIFFRAPSLLELEQFIRGRTEIFELKTVGAKQEPFLDPHYIGGYTEKVLCTQYPSTRCSTHLFFPARLENPYEGIIVVQWQGALWKEGNVRYRIGEKSASSDVFVFFFQISRTNPFKNTFLAPVVSEVFFGLGPG